jgi:hypothetical protein
METKRLFQGYERLQATKGVQYYTVNGVTKRMIPLDIPNTN